MCLPQDRCCLKFRDVVTIQTAFNDVKHMQLISLHMLMLIWGVSFYPWLGGPEQRPFKKEKEKKAVWLNETTISA